MQPAPPPHVTQRVKIDKLMEPIYCGPGRLEIETKRFRYVRAEYEDRLWLVNGVHKLCLHHSWRRGDSPAMTIEKVEQLREGSWHAVL